MVFSDITTPQARDAIGSVLRARAQQHPDRICCAMDDTTFSFAQMDARSDTIAAGLAALGIRKGDRVATLSPNRTELLELFYGTAKTGAIQLPLNPYLKGEFLRHQLAQSGAGMVLTDTAGVEALSAIRADLPDLTRIVTFDDAAGGIAYGELSAGGDKPPDVTVTATDTMSILYTSGTTGLPKGCIASHGYYCRSADIIGSALEITDSDVLFSALPLFHAGGQLLMVAQPLLFGIPTYLQSSFSASRFFAQATGCGATVMIAVGPMGAAILATEPSPADRDHAVKRIMCAPLSVSAQREFRDRFGVEPWVDVFGQSECMPMTVTPLSSSRRDPQGCGIPAPDLDVALFDDEGNAVEGEGTGEICVRPHNRFATFDGYFAQPEENSASDGWHRSGDYGRRLPSGALAFVDRKKDALRRRGENISSLELEAAIDGHPRIVESAVHAVPSDLGEDNIKACIVVSGEVSPAELFDYFRQHLPYFAIPRYVEVMEALPRNGVGRVMKHKLRAEIGGPGTWDLEGLGLTVSRADRR